jgi:N-acetylneuraminate lyase
MPEVYQTIYRAAESGDWEKVRVWQSHANTVLDVLLRYPFFPALREMMRHRGFDCGPLLSGEALTESQRNALIEDLNREIPKEAAELIGWAHDGKT